MASESEDSPQPPQTKSKLDLLIEAAERRRDVSGELEDTAVENRSWREPSRIPAPEWSALHD